MINFETVAEVQGIPVFFQKMPAMIRSVSVRLIMFVGSADDETVGKPGVFHWFEHVPFRGTKRFPGGNRDTLFRFDRFSGTVGAHTGPCHTAYHASVPKRFFGEALELIADLAGEPLLEDEDINAERTIICEEVAQSLSSAPGFAAYHLPTILWDGHPVGHPVIGSEESLQGMTARTLREAHVSGYDRSRCIIMVAGDLEKSEITAKVEEVAGIIPARGLEERRSLISYGELPPWQEGRKSVINTGFDSSAVLLGFPVPSLKSDPAIGIFHDLVTDMCDGPESPLFQIVREDRQLAYGTCCDLQTYHDGGFWGLSALTRPRNEEAVVEAFWEVLRSEAIRTTQRLALVREAEKCRLDMRVPSPESLTNVAERRLTAFGSLLSDDDYLEMQGRITLDQISKELESLKPEIAHTVIFRGKGKDT